MNKAKKTCNGECKLDQACFKHGCPWYENLDYTPVSYEEGTKHDESGITREEYAELMELLKENEAKGFADRELKEQTGKYHLCAVVIPDHAGRALERFAKFGPLPQDGWVEVKMFKDRDEDDEE
jgi:hypothetical protein